MAHVLDAFALTAYFEKEPGYEQVQELLVNFLPELHKFLVSREAVYDLDVIGHAGGGLGPCYYVVVFGPYKI